LIDMACPVAGVDMGRKDAVPMSVGERVEAGQIVLQPVCTENLIGVDAVMESPKLAE
jgi:hypothetical protein